MDFISIFIVSAALAMDAFSVSISAGIVIGTPGPRHFFRLAFHFGLFQFMMPIIGYGGGIYLEKYIKSFAHWIAFGLLLFIGLKMLWEAIGDNEENTQRDPSKGINLIMLSIATSIDALAVGFSMGILNKPILLPSIIIGITCCLFSIIGIMIGTKARKIIGQRAEIIGGITLIIIGIKILFNHIT
jgi:putative Mn2+ efflux pump MntP